MKFSLLLSTDTQYSTINSTVGLQICKNVALQLDQNRTFLETSTDARQPVHAQQIAGPGPVTLSV